MKGLVSRNYRVKVGVPSYQLQESSVGHCCKYCGISNLPSASVSVVSPISIIIAEPAAVAENG